MGRLEGLRAKAFGRFAFSRGNSMLRFWHVVVTVYYNTLVVVQEDAANNSPTFQSYKARGKLIENSFVSLLGPNVRTTFTSLARVPNCFFVLLLLLPFIQSTKWTSAWIDAVFSTINIVCILIIENVGRSSHWMFGFVASSLLIRIFLYKNVFNSVAVAVTYLVAFRIDARPRGPEIQYEGAVPFIVEFAFIAAIFYSVIAEKIYRRLYYRTWDHIHILIVLREKAKRCRDCVANVVSAHLPAIVVDHVFDSATTTLGSNFLSRSRKSFKRSTDENENIVDNSKDATTRLLEEKHKRFIKHAKEKDIIFDSTNDASLNCNDIKLLEGLDRRFCSLIAVRICAKSKSDLISEYERFALDAVINEIAERRNVVHIRTYGSIWLGCAGFFQHQYYEDKDHLAIHEQNLSWEVLMMACEVQTYMKHMNRDAVFAIDANKIVGGFLPNSPNFSVFGSELRWVLRVAQEFPLYDESRIFVSPSVREFLIAKEATEVGSGARVLEFTSRRFAAATSNHASFQTTEKAYSLPQMKHYGLISDENMLLYTNIYAKTNHSQWIDEYKYLLTEFRAHQKIQEGSFSNCENDHKNDTDTNFDEEADIRKILTEWSYEIVSSELLNHCDAKYRGVLSDPLTNDFSDEEILSMHEKVLKDVQQAIRQHFFASAFHYFFLFKREDLVGLNEWRPNTVSDLMGRPLKGSCEAAGPMEVLITVFASVLPGRFVSFASNLFTRSHIFREPVPESKATPRSSLSGINRKVVPVNFETFSELQKESNDVEASLPLRMKPSSEFVERECVEASSTKSSASSSGKQAMNQQVPARLQTKVEANAKSKTLEMNFNEFRRDIMLVSSSPFIAVCCHFVSLFACLFCFYYFPIKLIDASVFSSDRPMAPTTIYGFLWGMALTKIAFERTFDSLGYIICIPVVFAAATKFPVSDAMCIAPNHTVSGIGDSDGESMLFAFLFLIFSADLRMPIYWLYIWYFTVFLAINTISNRSSVECNQTSYAKSRLQISVYFTGIFSVVRWVLEYAVFVLYTIETKLTPESLRLYQADLADAYNMILLFEPAFKHPHLECLVAPRIYPSCTIITVNVKASTFLPGILECNQFRTLYSQVSHILNKIISEFGLLKVTEFSGMITIVESKELCDHSFHSTSNHKEASRTAYFLTTLQQRIEDYAVMNKFNVELDIGVDHGQAMLGLLGGKRHCLDISGYARDLSQIVSSLSSTVSGKPQTIISGNFAADERAVEYFKNHYLLRPASLMYRKKRIPIQLVEQALSGMTLDDFDLIAWLGKGGYGSVHLVREVKTAQLYAVKVIPQKASFISGVTDREFRALQRLHFPNVVSFKYFLMNDAKVYLFMNYVEGGTLQQVVDRYEPPIAHLTFWFAELVLAIEYVHSVGIIHRDVKPANCMIGTDGHLRLCDFGLSKSILRPTPSHTAGIFREYSDVASTYSTAAALTLDIETHKTLEKLMPIKSRPQENFSESSYNIMLIPLVQSKTASLSAERHSKDSRKTLLDMFFSVTVASSFDDAKNLLTSLRIAPEVIIIELISAHELISDEKDLLEVLKEYLQEMHEPGGPFEGVPLMILSSPNFLDEKLQQHFKRHFLGLKHFLIAPLSFSDRASLMYFGRMTRKALSDNAFMETLQEAEQHKQSDVSHSFSVNESPTLNFMDWKEGNNTNFKAGTAHFMAPEIIMKGEYSKSIDWWACGVTFYHCTMRANLIEGNVIADVLRKICHDVIDVSALHPISPSLEELVKGLLIREVSDRIGTSGASHVRQHAFFKEINWSTFQLTPPFKPGLELQIKAKNMNLFYGNSHRPSTLLSSDPKGGHPFSNTHMSHVSSLRKAKSTTKNHMRQELSRFGDLVHRRESWIRQSVNENDNISFKERAFASKRDISASTGMSFLLQESIQEENSDHSESGAKICLAVRSASSLLST